MKIYFPMVADILTPGHIKCLEAMASPKYSKNPMITIGLYDEKALKEYKACVMSYEDRKYILERLFIKNRFGTNALVAVVPQSSQNPYKNLMKYKMTAIASGAGDRPVWTNPELEGIEKWRNECGCEFPMLEINFKGEKKGTKMYASRKVKQKICQITK